MQPLLSVNFIQLKKTRQPVIFNSGPVSASGATLDRPRKGGANKEGYHDQIRDGRRHWRGAAFGCSGSICFDFASFGRVTRSNWERGTKGLALPALERRLEMWWISSPALVALAHNEGQFAPLSP
jgi:hypothetical protein